MFARKKGPAKVWLERSDVWYYTPDLTVQTKQGIRDAILRFINSPQSTTIVDEQMLASVASYGQAVVIPLVTASSIHENEFREAVLAVLRRVEERAVGPLVSLLDQAALEGEFRVVLRQCRLGLDEAGAQSIARVRARTARVVALDALSDIVCEQSGPRPWSAAVRSVGRRYQGKEAVMDELPEPVTLPWGVQIPVTRKREPEWVIVQAARMLESALNSKERRY